MVSRTARESKAKSTHLVAMEIIEAEQKQRQLKTARLRKLRMAKQAEADDPQRVEATPGAARLRDGTET